MRARCGGGAAAWGVGVLVASGTGGGVGGQGSRKYSALAMAFPVVMYGCESWTVKKAECRRIDAFELWYWRRLLRVPWTTDC